MAVELADRDGLGALSMRRIATELGLATMSIYRYLPGKDGWVVRVRVGQAAGRARALMPPDD
jgi:AcrR family transcriptional regulator